MAIATFRRYERKFVIDYKQYEEILPEIEKYMAPDKYCVDGRSYAICNLYFDTDEDEVIRHSVSSPYYKEKLRLRSYGTPENDDATVFLEIKKKTAKLVTKRRAVMTLAQAREYISKGKRPVKNKYLDNQVLDETDYFLSHKKAYPKVYIAYDRRAYFSKDGGQTRLTFDFNIVTRRDDLKLESGKYGQRLLPEDKVLMEIKVPGAFPLWLSNLLSEHKIFSSGFSKYGKEFMYHLTEGISDADDGEMKIPHLE